MVQYRYKTTYGTIGIMPKLRMIISFRNHSKGSSQAQHHRRHRGETIAGTEVKPSQAQSYAGTHSRHIAKTMKATNTLHAPKT